MIKKYSVCRECNPNHIDNCETCFGFGVYIKANKSYGMITSQHAWHSRDNKWSEDLRRCPDCGSDIYGYGSSYQARENRDKIQRYLIVLFVVIFLVIILWLQSECGYLYQCTR